MIRYNLFMEDEKHEKCIMDGNKKRRLKGLSFVDIAKKYNIDRRTAKKYALDHKKQSYVYKNPRKRKIDTYTSCNKNGIKHMKTRQYYN